MTRKKLQKFAELETFPNYFEVPHHLKGRWNTGYFYNQNPLVLELGCGKGEFSNRLGQEFPDKNFIGIDLKGVRLWRAAKNALNDKLEHVAFIKANITDLESMFGSREISEIWIPFPDPYPKPSKWKKRLVSIPFLERYKRVLKPGGEIHFKSDNTALFKFCLESIHEFNGEIIEKTTDLYNSDILNHYNGIPTYFETMFRQQGESIKYIRFKLGIEE